MFRKERQQYFKQQDEANAAAEKPVSFEEYSASKHYQLQQELFNLVKAKIGTADKSNVQQFYSKIQDQLKATGGSQKLDDFTMKKIQALIFE